MKVYMNKEETYQEEFHLTDGVFSAEVPDHIWKQLEQAEDKLYKARAAVLAYFPEGGQ